MIYIARIYNCHNVKLYVQATLTACSEIHHACTQSFSMHQLSSHVRLLWLLKNKRNQKGDAVDFDGYIASFPTSYRHPSYYPNFVGFVKEIILIWVINKGYSKI